MSALPETHRSHDYAFLVKRWKALAKRAGLNLQPFAQSGEHPLYYLDSRSGSAKASNRERCIYISAGVHGDEAAPPWGVLEWAEENERLLKTHRFLIFPCMNPNGLINNTRMDHRGVDINRTFHDLREPMITAWRAISEPIQASLALCLHEDYDGQGIYLYELNQKPELVGHRILEDCAKIIPLDLRSKIDTSSADRGLINRKRLPKDMPGLPEAIVLYRMGVPVSLTFESPSEFSLVERIAVQKQFIVSSLHHALDL
jgi:murein peptide amidase A